MELVLLGKPDCHLCHVMREAVERVIADYDVGLIVRDVRDDPELERRYVLEIPVLLLGQREVARHAVSESQLRGRLDELLPRRTGH